MPPQQTREEFIKSLFILEPQENIHNDAKERLIKGIQKGVDAVKGSFGSQGSNVILEEEHYPYTKTTNDGKEILKNIRLSDKVENLGINILREVADKSDRESGDGRKTSVVLTGAILEEGLKAKESSMEIRKSLKECFPLIISSLDKQSKPITTHEIKDIATIASENETLGAIFQEIYTEIGKDGIVMLDNSGLPATFYEIIEGVRLLGCGFLWPYMANDPKGKEAIFNNPKVLITKEKISGVSQLEDIFQRLSKSGVNELVMFADEIDIKVSEMVAKADMAGVFKTLIIKAPTLWKDWIYEDFSAITGATVVNPAEGTSLKSFSLSWLGTCGKIVTSKEETVVTGIQDVSAHIEALTQKGTEEAKIRIARLKTKTAILKLGANSETELSYIKGKALDARNASFLALQGGVVEGGGVALSKAIDSLPDTVGGRILAFALLYPKKQIEENGGKLPDDMFKAGIIDPTIVVKNSITNALSVASTVLTANIVITK